MKIGEFKCKYVGLCEIIFLWVENYVYRNINLDNFGLFGKIYVLRGLNISYCF